ncbi:MAG TPA: hypothetical protein VJR47_04515 [Stellaceae bacterium]|nr:hypothetical protein [Stellaceae bacterium]
MKRNLMLAGALALVACSTQPEWTKEGTSPQVADRELADCKSLAREATARDTNIMTDIMASRGGDWQRTGVMETHVQNFAAGEVPRSDDIVKRCMIGKGFAPAQ